MLTDSLLCCVYFSFRHAILGETPISDFIAQNLTFYRRTLYIYVVVHSHQ